MEETTKILIIDDSPVAFKSIKKILDVYEKFQVVSYAQDGWDGIALYKEYKPDIVMLDIVMPGMDGLETAKRILATDPKAQIIGISSMGYEKLLNKAKDIGFKSFVQKPFTTEDIIIAIGEIGSQDKY